MNYSVLENWVQQREQRHSSLEWWTKDRREGNRTMDGFVERPWILRNKRVDCLKEDCPVEERTERVSELCYRILRSLREWDESQ